MFNIHVVGRCHHNVGVEVEQGPGGIGVELGGAEQGPETHRHDGKIRGEVVEP